MAPVTRPTGVRRAGVVLAVLGVGVLGALLFRDRGGLGREAAPPGPVEVALGRSGEAPASFDPGLGPDVSRTPARGVASRAGARASLAGPEPQGLSLDGDDRPGVVDPYAEFLALARRDPGGLAERAREELLGEGPDARKIALLRALAETGSPRAHELFALAILTLPVRSTAHSSSVPEYAVHSLGQRAEGDGAARAVLRSVAFGPDRSREPSLRLQAAIHLGRTSTDSELQTLAAIVRAEPDELLRAGFAAGLLSNPEERIVELLFSDLLAAREALAGSLGPHQELDTR